MTPKFISRSDPAAQWTDAHKGHAFFAYANNYLIDTDHGVIVDVEATRAIRQAEVRSARRPSLRPVFRNCERSDLHSLATLLITNSWCKSLERQPSLSQKSRAGIAEAYGGTRSACVSD